VELIMSTYADRKAAWAAHNLHRHQASIWAAERARIFREEEIERLAQEQMEDDRIKSEARLNNPAQRDYLKERARKMYRQGSSMRDISNKLDVPYSLARRWVVDLKVKSKLPPDVLRTKELRDQGYSYREIAEMMNCSLGTAWAHYAMYLDMKKP
jgi:hypothetical protein